jgi:hypothetical protein
LFVLFFLFLVLSSLLFLLDFLVRRVQDLADGNLVFDAQLSSSGDGENLVALDALNLGLSVRETSFDGVALLANQVDEVGVGSRDGSSEFVGFEFMFERYVEQIVFHDCRFIFFINLINNLKLRFYPWK